MQDVPEFINKAHTVYGYDNLINDAGGSLCELDSPEVIECLAEHTLILYIKATDANEKELIQRAEDSPKPMYYQEAFLDEQLAIFMREHRLEYVATVDPDDFVRWVFPRLFYARIPRYEAISKKYGYTVTTSDVSRVQSEEDFLSMLTSALD